MKKSTLKKIHELIRKENPNANIMVAMCDVEDDIVVSLQGKRGKIGQALFAAMHDTDNPELAKSIYLMVKNLAFNIINNPSEMADDMTAMFFQTTDNDINKTGCEMFPFKTQGEA